MGLDVANKLFGNFHLSWTGTSWFRNWCYENGLPDPFIGWVSGDNSGEECQLGSEAPVNSEKAKAWCKALEETNPDIAEMGRRLLAKPPEEVHAYLYPRDPDIPRAEWDRRAVACWYAILQYGLERGDTLAYW